MPKRIWYPTHWATVVVGDRVEQRPVPIAAVTAAKMPQGR
jgi:hypothetical protein